MVRCSPTHVALLTFGCLLAHTTHAGAQAASLTVDQRLARDLLAELIGINTTHEHGNTTLAALAIARRLGAAGFPLQDVLVVGPGEKDRNLVARLRGTGARRPILLLAHLDVVAAIPSDWSRDPFTLTEQDGYFYGRGTSDIKDMAVIFVATLLRLKRERFVPDRDIILALTAGEESGADYNGVQWLLANRRDLIDAAYCINGDGGDPLQLGGKPFARNLQASEKVYESFQLEVTNPGGHSSLPVPDNAIYRLAAARGDSGAMARLSAQSPFFNAQLRTTCVATRLDAGHADNALPQRARAVVNCRLLPDERPGAVLATLRSVVADSAVRVMVLDSAVPSPPSPLGSEVLGPIEAVSAGLWPGVPVIPKLETGATDGLYLRNAGMPVYGVSGVFLDADDIRAHGRDERIGVGEYYAGVEFTYRLVKALGAPTR